jgi:hypothetical protein
MYLMLSSSDFLLQQPRRMHAARDVLNVQTHCVLPQLCPLFERAHLQQGALACVSPTLRTSSSKSLLDQPPIMLLA